MFSNNTIEIEPSEPFKNDILDRKVIADNLTKIIEKASGSIVLSIDSAWGTGKTTFVKMWKCSLDSNDNFISLYYNAWDNDDFNDPLLAILGIFEEYFNKKESSGFERIKTFSKPLLKKAIPTALKILTHGILDLKDVEFGEYNESQLTELVGSFGELEFRKLREEKKAKEEFCNALTEFQKEQGKKIVIFIDELDRCRPSFAVETLERIKHLFNIDNYIFVLSLDKSQLSHSISTMYGNGMDSLGYLRRFIDIDYMLPLPDKKKYAEMLIQRIGLENNKKSKWFWFFLDEYVRIYDFSLRDLDKLFYYLNILLPTTPLYDSEENYKETFLLSNGILYALLVVVKMKEQNLYQKLVSKDYSASDILDVLRTNKVNIVDDGYYSSEWIKSIFHETLNKFLHRNTASDIQIREGNSKIGKEDTYPDTSYDLNHLWDKQGCKLFRQLDFLDNFNLI
ncbi:MAG TPA: P-loop NTPase fold protein [Clostridia bacterium]|nr:P-loop NTPase fold protein [Clostridia bacterium]